MSTRREFLHSGGCFALALAAALSLQGDLAALPVRLVAGAGDGDLRQYPIPETDAVNVDWKAQVILARYKGFVYAFSLACPHQQAAVQWLPQDQRFQCTKHHSRYAPTGVYLSGRATRNLDRFAIARSGDQASVNLAHWFQSDKDAAGWAAAAIRL